MSYVPDLGYVIDKFSCEQLGSYAPGADNNRERNVSFGKNGARPLHPGIRRNSIGCTASLNPRRGVKI